MAKQFKENSSKDWKKVKVPRYLFLFLKQDEQMLFVGHAGRCCRRDCCVVHRISSLL